jgi:hypothetical protein
VEIATHPILRATRANRENPIHSHPTRVCVSCVTNTGLPKSADLRSRTAGKADRNASRFLDWPGGEAVKYGPTPRSGVGRLHRSQNDRGKSRCPRRTQTQVRGQSPPSGGGVRGVDSATPPPLTSNSLQAPLRSNFRLDVCDQWSWNTLRGRALRTPCSKLAVTRRPPP